MPRDIKVIDVFLSSPGDLNDERAFILELGREWNSLHGRKRLAHINILTWEDVVVPAISDRSQSVINEQIGDDYDVYLGLMWSKLGSSTGIADSGTVEEFDRALDRYRGGETIRLAMLFKTADVPMAILNGEQYDKVKKFQKRYADEGGMYRKFAGLEDLRQIIYRLFEQIAEMSATGDGGIGKPSRSEDSKNAQEQAEDPDESLGLIELNEQINEEAEGQAKFLEGWSALMTSNTKKTQDAVEKMADLAKFGSVNPVDVTKIMAEVSIGLDQLSVYIEGGLSGFAERNDRIIYLTNAGFDILEDFNGGDQKEDWINANRSLLLAIKENRESIETMLETVAVIPRLSGVFNRSRTQFSKIQNKLLDEMARLEGMLKQALADAESRGWS